MNDSIGIDRSGADQVAGSWKVPGAVPALYMAGSAALLHAEEQVFEAMLAGWSDQQCARNLNADTVTDRARAVRRFRRFTNDWPWAWRPVDVEEFSTELRGDGRTLTTVRAYQGALRQFLDYVCDPRYQWTAACERLFGAHPSQICFEWNTAAHAADYEGRPGRRALTPRAAEPARPRPASPTAAPAASRRCRPASRTSSSGARRLSGRPGAWTIAGTGTPRAGSCAAGGVRPAVAVLAPTSVRRR
jgi:hypothetical protein